MKGGFSHSRILICNDDGIHSEGIKVIEKAALSVTKDVWVVAPAYEQSGTGHSFTMHRSMSVKKVSERHYTVEGTPTDCVIYACRHLLRKHLPDLILSGINQGANLGSDVTYSGTVGAAIEGTLQGIRSIALSLHGAKSKADTQAWKTAEKYAPEIIKKLMSVEWAPQVLMNVNFPSIPPEQVSGIEISSLGQCKIGNDISVSSAVEDEELFQIGYARHEDPSIKGTDLEAVLRGAITITPVTLNMAHDRMISDLCSAF